MGWFTSVYTILYHLMAYSTLLVTESNHGTWQFVDNWLGVYRSFLHMFGCKWLYLLYQRAGVCFASLPGIKGWQWFCHQTWQWTTSLEVLIARWHSGGCQNDTFTFECFLTTKEKHMIVWKPEVLAIIYGTFANTCSIVVNLTSKQHYFEKEQRNVPTCHILTCDMLPHLTSCFCLETHFKLRIIICLFVGTV